MMLSSIVALRYVNVTIIVLRFFSVKRYLIGHLSAAFGATGNKAMSRKRKAGSPETVAEGYVSMNELASRLTISRATVYRWIEIGLLPHPVKLGPSRVGFLESEIAAFQASRPRALGGALTEAV